MNFNKITYGLFTACGLAMTLTACQNEADLGNVTGNYISVPVSTVITVPDDGETRTTLNENAGNLEWKWEKGDMVVAFDMLTGVRGYLTAGEPTNDGKTAPFSGSINFQEGAKTAKLAIFYLGKGEDPSSLGNTLTINLENQDGKFASLVSRDVLATGTSQASAVDVTINPTYTVINDFELRHLTSAGHFQLKIKDGETINNADVTISGTENGYIINPVSYTIAKGNTFAQSASEDGTIKTTTSATGDFYITIFPYSETAMKFVTTYNGKEYTGYLGGSEDFTFNLSGGQYLRSNSNNFGPLVIEMETDEPVVVGPDHSKNPLKKWAESDLMRSTTGAESKSVFTGNPLITGSYYQFGRNHGYTSVSDAQKLYAVEASDIPNGRNVYPANGSTSTVPQYSGAKSLTNYPTYFFIDTNHDGDYVTPARQDTWSVRAKKNGYTYENPCPEGWTIPTKADFWEILPEVNGKHSYTNASILWGDDGFSQLKTLSDGTKCAFRWTGWVDTDYNCYYLRIECKVVGSDVTSIPSEDDFWTDDTEVRDFKGAGYILAQRNLWSNGVSTQYVARPLAWGKYSCVQQGQVVVYRLTQNLMTEGGYYWTSDAEQAAFCTMFDLDGITGNTQGIYMCTLDRPIAMNIRCIKKN